MPPIGAMEVVLSADAAALLSALDRVENRLKKTEEHAAQRASGIARAFRTAQAAFVGFAAAIATSRAIGWFNQAAKEVDNLGKAGLRLGLSVPFLSALKLTAEESGLEFNALATGISRAGREVSKLVQNGQTAVRVGDIAVRLTDQNGKIRDMAELVPDIARGIESASSAADQLNFAQKFFGREGGDRFVTLLRESNGFIANFADQTERARRLGVLFTDEQFEKLRAYRDSLGRIDQALLGLRVRILTDIAPSLTKVANLTASAIAAAPEMIRRLVTAIDQAFSKAGGPLGDQLELVIDDIGAVTKRGVELAIRLGFGVAVDMLKIVFPALKGEFQRGFHDSILQPFTLTMQAVVTATRVAFPKAFPETMAGISRVLEMYQVALPRALNALDDPFNDLDKNGAAWRRQWEIGSARVIASLRALGIDADKLIGISDLLAKHAMTGFERVRDGANGAAGAVVELDERFADLADSGSKTIAGFASSASDALAEFALDGEASFEDLARSWTKTLLSMAAEALVFKPLFEGLGADFSGLFTGGKSTAPSESSLINGPPSPTGNAHGNVYTMKGFVHKAAAGMILNQRTRFPGMKAEAAEAGHPEWAFAPLRRIGGDLGVKSAPANVTVQVVDQRQSGARPQVSERTGPNGQKVISVLVRDEIQRGISDGSLDRVMGDTYGLRRRGAGR